MAVHGTTIRALREAVGLTREQLAERLAITPAHLGRLETGKRTLSPMLQSRLEIAAASAIFAEAGLKVGLSVRQAAALTSLAEQTIRDEMYTGTLPSVKVGARLIIRYVDLEDWLATRPRLVKVTTS